MQDASTLVSPWPLSGPVRPDLIRNETLAEVFAATVARTPGAPALSMLGSRDVMTYRELDRRAARTAAALAARGVRPGDRVGLWMRRSTDIHVAMLGILKAGAGFVPFDAEAPVERVQKCLDDCGVRVLVTHPALVEATARLAVDVASLPDLDGQAPADADRFSAPLDPDATAYSIYTSGSTGEPKGIAISHRNACHYIRAVNELLGIGPSDVVLQQASVAFDLSIEEIFVPFLVGASIKVSDEASLRAVDTLADRLEADKVTVIDAVPTLLAMLERRPRSLRIAIAGGEACSPTVVEKFSGGGCRLFNTYGPTETTVVATGIELKPGQPVTIGRPIANYTAYVVDDALQLVAPGQSGELLIGGPSVAAGYIKRPELTAAKFIANPFVADGERAIDPVLYRTGDEVSLDANGNLAFHGRIDAQVKVRGYRIELGEIETLLQQVPGVRNAAVVAAPGPGGNVLVAHLVADGPIDLDAAKERLAGKLPPYMLPTFWSVKSDLPRLASGKVDRKALAALGFERPAGSAEQEPPRNETEGCLLAAAQKVLGLSVVDLEADFFTGLGGHSLLAAQFVSEVRKTQRLASVSLQDLYAARSLRKLAGVLEARAGAGGGGAPADLSFEPPPFRRRFLCGLAQFVTLPFIIMLVTAQWIGLLLASIYLVRDGASIWVEMLTLGAVFVTINLGSKLLVIALKWLLIGRIEPGVYPLWGVTYYRIWLLQRLLHMTAPKFLQGSPLMGLYLNALGAKIGRDAIIHEFEDGMIDLVEIGPRASLGTKIRFANAEVIGNEIHVGRIVIGADAHIGNSCVIAGDTEIGAGAELGDLTAVQTGMRIPAGERWEGAAAQKVGTVDHAALPVHPEIGALQRAARTVGFFIAFNVVMMIGLLPIFPAFYVLSYFDAVTFGVRETVVPWYFVLLLAWPAALVLVAVSMAVVVVLRWLLLPFRVQPGRYSIYSGFYFRKWVVGLATEAMLETLNSLDATVFMRNWYRLMGTKVGRGTEISSNFSGRYDLIELGKNNFLGDEVIFGDEEIRNGWMTLRRVKTGDRSFFGNLAVVPGGSVIESDAMLGVKSRMPEGLHIKSGETWFGSPAIPIPNRQRMTLSANMTYEPPLRMRVWRCIFEALHTSFPTAMLITLAYIIADMLEFPIDAGRYDLAFLVFMLAGIGTAFVMFFVSVAFKWLAMGVYKPVNKPMWSWWAMRTEAVSVVYGGLASKVLLDFTRGTPFMPWLLRLYGTKIGRGVYMNCADVTEFDCITIGDFTVINMHCNPQTHLYEDRVMKVGRVEIGRGVTLGSGSLILYDTKVGDFARLSPLTLVMKGEHVPAHTVWAGAPSRLVTETSTAAPPKPAEARAEPEARALAS